MTYNWQNKYAARANVSYTSSNDKFKVDFGLGQVRSRLQGASAFQPITTSILWACNFPGCEPDPANPTTTGYNDGGHGYQFYRPEDYDMVRGFDNVDRTTVSLKLTHRPYSWLRHTLTVGPDLTNNKSSLEVELNANARRPFFSNSNGSKYATQQRSTFLTLDYAVSGDWNVSKSLVASTAAGAQYYSKEFEFVRGTGDNFSIPGGGNISSGAQIGASEGYQQNKTVGVYAQEQLAFKNRLFLTGALRGDDNSAFGSNFNAVYYPKVSASWVASEEGFLRDSKIFSQLKLRGAWGRAGNQPDVFSAIRTYQAKVGSLGLGGITPQNFGNANLKPEIGEELEAGFDAGLFNQRVGIEFTFYNKDIKDAILSLPLRPSRGFPGSQFLNIGKTRNRGIELGLDGSPVQTKNFSVDLRATLATNSSLILDMGGTPPAFTGGSFIQQYDVQGFAPSSFFFQKVVSSDVQTLNIGIPLPLGFNVKCEGGTDLGRGNGTVVDCAGAPRLYAGRPTPSWNGSFSATFTIGKRLRILGLVDAVGGHTSLVGDVAGVHSFFLSSKQALEGKDQILSGYLGLAILQGNGDAVGATGLTKGGWAKLRTVSASYDLPKKIAQFFGATRGSWTVAAENMAILWRAQKDIFGVKWIDPEIAANYSADRVGNNGYTQESWPQLARIRTTVRFTF